MLGAYFAYDISRTLGFWPALVSAPALCFLIGAAIEMYGLRQVHKNGHIAELLFTFGIAFIIEKAVQMVPWGLLPVAYRVGGARPTAVCHLRYQLPRLSRLYAADPVLMFVAVLDRADAHAHRPGHPGGADASRNGLGARPQCTQRSSPSCSPRAPRSRGWLA